MVSKKQSKARDSESTVVRTTRSTRSADRSPYARRVTRSNGKATAAVEPDNGSGQSRPPSRRRSKRNEGPASSSRPTNSSQPKAIALRATESSSTLSQTLVAEGTQASTSNDNDTVHSRVATPKSEAHASDEDEGEDFVQFSIAPVDPFPSPPPDEYSPTPERDWQPFDPVKSPTPPPPGSRAQIESALPDAQRVATPDDDSPPRSTPPLYYPAWPPSPTLLDRHPQTWLDEVLVSIERQRGNLVSELRDAEVDVKDALAESFKALVAVKELVGPQGLDGLEKALDLSRGGRRKGDRRGGDPEIVGLMRMVQAMVGPEMVKKMLTDARDTAAGDDFEEDEQVGEGVVDVDGEHSAANQRADEIGTPMELTVGA